MSFWKNWQLSFGKAQPTANLSQRWNHLAQLSYAAWLVIILTMVLLAAIVQWWWRFQLPPLPSELVVSKAPAAAPPALALEKLADLHLFGQNIQQDINALPETSLKLELKGIYSDPNQKMGSAIIAVPGEADKVYLIGDTLPGGATLLEIHEDRVILRRAGQLEVLMLPQKQLEIKNKN